MPPKGWRKNADGAYPVTSKERDSISIDDILFPKATVNRLARAIIPDGGILSKDSATAVQRSATVFVSYLLVHARANAKKFDRKTIGPQDILAALQSAEFSSFIPSVKHELDSYQAHKDAVKQRKKAEKEKLVAEAAASTSGATEGSKDDGNTSQTGNETVDENDSYATTNENPEDDEEDTQNPDQAIGPQSKKIKTGDDTVDEV